uniref:Uncharacterized protein n=1 Tax=Anguilla anguilla TaxID=7936 RepID=A0A0E9QF20_ANGAN
MHSLTLQYCLCVSSLQQTHLGKV